MNTIRGFNLNRELFITLYNKFFNKSITEDEMLQFKNLLEITISKAIVEKKFDDAEKLNDILNIVQMDLTGKIKISDLDIKLANTE